MTAIAFDEQQLRLIAAKVLGIESKKHENGGSNYCRNCGIDLLQHGLSSYCESAHLPTEPLEVLGEKCKAKCGSLEYTKALFEQLGCDFNRRGDMELIAVAWAATSADKIIAAAKAKGIDI